MLNKVKKFLGLEYEIDNKVFLKAMRLYPYVYEAIGSYLSHVTKVWATRKGSKTVVHIKTHHPGILIGKGGEQINYMKTYMESLYGYPIEIDIQEENMFTSWDS